MVIFFKTGGGADDHSLSGYCESTLFRWEYIFAEMKNLWNFYMLTYQIYTREFVDFHSSANILTRENKYLDSKDTEGCRFSSGI